MRLMVTGGGTGGHIYPAIALAQEARRLFPDSEILYMGGRGKMESEIVPAEGIPFTGVTVRSLRKLMSFSSVGTAMSLVKGYTEARNHLSKWRPDVAIGAGGYVAGASMLAAAHLKIPTLVLAPDSAPGRTNLMISRFAKKVCIWLGDVESQFPSGKCVRLGLPIRSDIVTDLSKTECRSKFGLANDKFTILVIGGSQGAQSLNEFVLGALAKLPPDCQILHQTGPKNLEAVQLAAGKASGGMRNHLPIGYLQRDQTPIAYGAADIILCRSGVSTLAEAAANGLPILMVPLPTAYADHQTSNAKAMEEAGAGKRLVQGDLTVDYLVESIIDCKNNPALLAKMGASSKMASRPNAASDIVIMAREMAGK